MTPANVPYGQCVGVPGLIPPHRYEDGRPHFPHSHGLCSKCRDLTMRLFRSQVSEARHKATVTSEGIDVSSA